MHEGLYTTILERLTEDASLDPQAAELIAATCEGPVALDERLEALGATGTGLERPPPVLARTKPPSAYLQRIEIAGFRGIGPKATLDLAPGPGLTIVLGRNGTGKSSFAEGLEVLLTGTSRRWAGRPKVWQEGWRCLHTTGKTQVSADFAVEGRTEPVRTTRTWAADAGLDGSRTGGSGDLAKLGWPSSLTTFRPFLSSRDLDAALEKGTSKLFDEMKSILGLSELTAAMARVTDRRKLLEKEKKDSKAALAAVLASLPLEDPRAEACRAALSGRSWDLEAAEAVIVGGEDTDPAGLDDLRRLTTLAGPKLDDLASCAEQLRVAVANDEALTGTQAERSARLAELLTQALEWQGEGALGDCPVCHGALPEDWRAHAAEEAERARTDAEGARAARTALQAAIRAAKALIRPAPACLAAVEVHELDSRAVDAWTAWSGFEGGALALAAHLEDHGSALAVALEQLRGDATQKLAALEDLWRPVAFKVAAWLAGARRVEEGEARRKALVAAESWMKGVEKDLRDDRFAPIADKAQAIWAKLRQQSDVDLTNVRLAGSATSRKVELDVTVAGKSGLALGVMSQGELNALALSLFLPRMLLDESPFRFVVVDDPVQSMDPTKVEGLAAVFGDAATTRQVVVFTHDPRLAEATRRLGIEATVVRVARREGSVVEVAPWLDPVRRHLDDAWKVAKEEQVLGREVAQRVVPGLCRMAIEAAAAASFRRARLSKGVRHEDVETSLDDAKGLVAVLTLALFGDPHRHGETYRKLNNKVGDWAVDLVKSLNEGSHEGWNDDLELLVRRTRDFVREMGR
jgi:hypothetical protein